MNIMENFKKKPFDGGGLTKSLYTFNAPKDFDYATDIGLPGEYPFVRGIHKNMYIGRPWTMRQYSGFGSAEETNIRFKYLLNQGQTGLSVAFDLPTQLGYDSNDPVSIGEVGKVGVPVDSLFDMEKIFEDLPIDQLSTSMTINAPAAILLAMYIVVSEKKKISSKKIRGTIQNDILKEYTVRGTYIFPPEPSIRLIRDTVDFCAREVPLFNAINIAGYHFREAGCSIVQEIAYSFSNAIQYIEACLDYGLDIDTFAPRISWIFNTSNKIFEEVAKYRAARKVWADIIRFRYKAKNPKSWMLRYHTHTSGVSLTSQQPENNIARIAYQVLAAVLGGAQSIAACSYDEALSLPSEKAATISLRTQQILLHETGVADIVDPLGGSYFIESLTKTIIQEVCSVIEKIDDMGGAINAIENRFIQNEIENRAFSIHKNIENNETIVVGVNKFNSEKRSQIPKFQYDTKHCQKQIEDLEKIKKNRNNKKVKFALSSLKKAALSDQNLMPYLIDTVKTYATIGEICSNLKEVFGEY
jgi:methylmalonyl-CoA mutase N-terminal domain/subunit